MIKGSENAGVYFVRNNNNGNVKIGCANNINNRFKALVASAKHIGDVNVDFELIDFIECEKDVNYLKLEKAIHKFMQNKRVINEWFQLNKEEILRIKKTFNTSDYLEENNYDPKDGNTICVVGENKYLLGNKVQHMIDKGKNYFSTNIIKGNADFFTGNIDRIDKYTNILDNISLIYKEEAAKPVFRDSKGIIYYDMVSIVRFIENYYKISLFSDEGLAEFFFKPIFQKMNEFISEHDIIKMALYYNPEFYEIMSYSFPNFSELKLRSIWKGVPEELWMRRLDI